MYALTNAIICIEVQIMRGLSHPSIVKLQNFAESPEHYFLILERTFVLLAFRVDSNGCL